MKAGTSLQLKVLPWRLCLKGLLLLALFAPRPTRAANFTAPGFLWTFTANYHSVNNAVLNPVSFEMQMGFNFSKFAYFGIAGDYFLASRGAGATSASMDIMSGGVELGIFRSYPRFFWLVTAGVFYPFVLELTDGAGNTFTTNSMPLSYRGRLIVGIRVSEKVAFTFGGGYRFALYNHFSGTSGAFAANPVNLTGMVISGGFTFTL